MSDREPKTFRNIALSVALITLFANIVACKAPPSVVPAETNTTPQYQLTSPCLSPSDTHEFLNQLPPITDASNTEMKLDDGLNLIFIDTTGRVKISSEMNSLLEFLRVLDYRQLAYSDGNLSGYNRSNFIPGSKIVIHDGDPSELLECNPDALALTVNAPEEFVGMEDVSEVSINRIQIASNGNNTDALLTFAVTAELCQQLGSPSMDTTFTESFCNGFAFAVQALQEGINSDTTPPPTYADYAARATMLNAGNARYAILGEAQFEELKGIIREPLLTLRPDE